MTPCRRPARAGATGERNRLRGRCRDLETELGRARAERAGAAAALRDAAQRELALQKSIQDYQATVRDQAVDLERQRLTLEVTHQELCREREIAEVCRRTVPQLRDLLEVLGAPLAAAGGNEP